MRVLVIGTQTSAERAVEALDRVGARAEHVDTIEPAVARLALAPERFGLVLAESAGDPCAERRFLDSVRAATKEVPVLFIREPGLQPDLGDVPPVCAVEQTDDGLQLLRCALACARARPERQSALAGALGERPLVFAYSAPTKGRAR